MTLTALINDVARMSGQVVLVLDDYHLLHTPQVHEAVTFLLDHLPPQLHLILTTRADPPLPLARLRARGELVELRAAHLRFTPDEVEKLLNQVIGLSLSTADVDALATRTEGWVAGLQLAALSLRDRDDVSAFVGAFTGSNRFVFDYLIDEVLHRQPDDVREFLLRTAVLERLTGPLCDAVTGRDGGGALLEELERANRAPGRQPQAVRHSHRRRPGRPRLVAVARAAHPGRSAPAQRAVSSPLDPAGAR